ncbi:MAG TPA: iron ABC transporter permease [Devosia sp.]|nr:iron ABC transporter permease [Devosia sp.]
MWLAGAAVLSLISGDFGVTGAMLPIAVRETGLLMLSVGFATGVLGLVAAWLTTHFEFPLRRWFDWALVLPLAIPTYLAAYSFTEFLDFTGPAQSLLRMLTGSMTIKDYWFPEIRSNAGAALVLSLVLYPYVYLSCRAFFLMQSGSAAAAGRVLGASGIRTLLTVVLPLSRPALIIGVTLAMMEVVNDLGAVQYFGVNSLTAVIYSTWINRASFGGAAQLAVMIVLIIGVLILAERGARRDRLFGLHRDSRTPPPREPLQGVRAAAAFAFCGGLVMFAFGVPAGELFALAFRKLDASTMSATLLALANTVVLALCGALITVGLGWYAAKSAGRGRSSLSRGAVRLSTLGYAIPGTVLALGLLQPLGLGDRLLNGVTRSLFGWVPGLVLSGTLLALLYVYAIRFLAVTHSSLSEAMEKRGQSMLDAGNVLGARGIDLLVRVDLPSLTPALLAAGTLVFVEIIKELPATLLLRPLGVETLSTLVYSKANSGLFAEAALPALAIVVAGLAPVILATQLSGSRKL